MCGIAAIFAHGADAPPVREAELVTVRDAMAARGPDGSGLWIADDKRVGLAHRRLAIIDLSAEAAQPMTFAPDGGSNVRTRITYNGEIYNYRALRAWLESDGAVFRTQSDTEVLLHLYDRFEDAMVEHLRGMYAFALWDEARRGVFLARDAFGIKPLYYADVAGTFRAASSVRALIAGGVETEAAPAGNVGFFLFGYVPEPHTLHRHIHALPAGSTMWVGSDGVKRVRRFFDIPTVLAEGRRHDASGDLRETLLDSVRHHLVADVPVGVFLSSGLDSATITGMASEIEGARLETLTLGFDAFKNTPLDEAPLAADIARHFGTRHRTRWVAGRDFHSELGAFLAAMDQPTINGVNTYFVAQAGAEAGLKVALSGLGGDELFAGYDSFRQIPALVGRLGRIPGLRPVGRAFRIVAAPVARRLSSPKYAGILEYGTSYAEAYLLRRGLFMPWELPDLVDAEMAREGWRELQPLVRLADCASGLESPRAKITALEMSFYMRNQLLRDADWAGMAHSVEIRVPFVDPVLLARVAAMVRNGAPGKREMANSVNPRLPGAVLERPKTGFFVPLREWLQGGCEKSRSGSEERGLRGWARRVYEAAWNPAR
jgi:asparagine synthase (glutamine-hydrolysing)